MVVMVFLMITYLLFCKCFAVCATIMIAMDIIMIAMDTIMIAMDTIMIAMDTYRHVT